MIVKFILVNEGKKLFDGPFKSFLDIREPSFTIEAIKERLATEGGWGPHHNLDIEVHHHPGLTRVIGESRDDVQTAISGLDLSKTRISSSQNVAEVISEQDLLLIVKTEPGEDILAKGIPPLILKRLRSASTSDREFRELKRARLVTTTPSTVGKPSTVKNGQVAVDSSSTTTQSPLPRLVLDDRPCLDAKVAPIALLYKPFGDFEDTCANDRPPVSDDVALAELEAHVVELTTAMAAYYTSDADRRTTGLRVLNKILAHTLYASEVDPARSDGHCEVDGIVITIAQFKNELAGISASPYIEGAYYVARSHINENNVAKYCGHYRIPALGIMFVGDYIQFYALVLLGHQYRLVSLTPMFSCSLAASNALHRKQLFHAFIAARILQKQIFQDLAIIRANPTPPSQFLPGEPLFPAITQLRQLGSAHSIKFRMFDYYGSSGDENYEHRHIYRAAQVDESGRIENSEILVKFCRRYSIDLHKFCADRGRAPQILGYELLPGGWHAIAMELLDEDAQPLDRRLASRQEQELRDLVRDFHEEGLVHGDLRAGNILCNWGGNQFWLVDFDWGGEADVVEYPTWLLNEELRVGRGVNNLVIRKEDDRRILQATLRQFQYY